MSHGFGGWAGGMTYLAENLASKGYVVAAIDHADGQGGSGGPDGRLRVAGTIINRARDQEAVIAALTAHATAATDVVARHIDAGNIAVIGYSMGGFGLMTTAGAPYDRAAALIAPLGDRLDDQFTRAPVPAPWPQRARPHRRAPPG